jgi:glyoxylase-like metal-dependent hydrolase (beta-lactamase superfamily II)
MTATRIHRLRTVKDIPEADAVRLLRDNLRPAPRRTSANCFLTRNGTRTALVDTGFGPVRPTVGFLQANLAAAGVTPEEIDVVLLTHMHPDHWGGLSDKQGRAMFPCAELKMHADDYAHWQDDSAMMRIEDPAPSDVFRRRPCAGGALSRADGSFHRWRSVSRRDDRSAAGPDARAYRLHDRLRQCVAADLG